MDEIIVVAKINNNNKIYSFVTLHSATGPYVPPTPEEDPQYDRHISVKVRVKNSANRSLAEQAAKRLEQALLNIELKLINGESLSFNVLPYNITAQQLVETFYNTYFTITDDTYNNSGVGSAEYHAGSGGSNLNKINFSAITDPNGYGSSNYTNGEGMTALILHEFSHLSDAGDAFFQDSIPKWQSDATQDRSSPEKFYQSDYAANVEAFANDVMIGYANMIGADISTNAGIVLPRGVQGAVPASNIYNSHNP